MASAQVTPIAQWVAPHEPAYRLYEVVKPTPDGKGRRRYQVVLVVRSDRLAEHWTDLGPAERFPPLHIDVLGGLVDENGRGFSEHTVEELREIADQLRADGVREVEPSDLSGAWRNYVEERARRRRGVSTFGAFARVERN